MLTQEQIDQFHRDGFLKLPQMITGRELGLLKEAADRVQQEGIAEMGSDHLYREIDGKRTYFRSERMWDRAEIFQAVTVNPGLLAAIGQCIGHPFLPINDSFVCKIPGGNVPVEWHQDPPYGSVKARDTHPQTFEVPNFDVDIYLDESTVENGCVWGIPGHHLVGHVEIENFSEDELFEHAVPLEMQPGDVLFHCLSAPHGSIGNKTDTIRRIFYVHYMAREVLEHSYPGWSDKRGGFNATGFRFVQGMFEARDRLGFGGIAGTPVQFHDEGIEFVGEPKSPPRHWGKLIEQMSEAQIEAKRRLEVVQQG